MRSVLTLILFFVVAKKVYSIERLAQILHIDEKCVLEQLQRHANLPVLTFRCPKRGGGFQRFTVSSGENLGKLGVGSPVKVVADVEILPKGELRPLQVHIFSPLLNPDGIIRLKERARPGALGRDGSLLKLHRKENDYLVF